MTISALTIWTKNGMAEGETGKEIAHSTISQLRAHAFMPGVDKRPVAAACQRKGVKRRVAKKWSIRLLREVLPREARITGPKPHSKNWRSR